MGYMKQLWIEEYNRWLEGEEVDPELVPQFEEAHAKWEEYYASFISGSNEEGEEARQ